MSEHHHMGHHYPPFPAAQSGPPQQSPASLPLQTQQPLSHDSENLPIQPMHQMYYPTNNISSALNSKLSQFWVEQYREAQEVSDFKNTELPLARIKKIMKSDEDVKMISAEAPVLFAKACEMFILELTMRAWVHTQESKRRTLQRNDIAAAVSKTDIFDFLIDIVPREEAKPPKKEEMGGRVDGQQYQMWMGPPGGPAPAPGPHHGSSSGAQAEEEEPHMGFPPDSMQWMNGGFPMQGQMSYPMMPQQMMGHEGHHGGGGGGAGGPQGQMPPHMMHSSHHQQHHHHHTQQQ